MEGQIETYHYLTLLVAFVLPYCRNKDAKKVIAPFHFVDMSNTLVR